MNEDMVNGIMGIIELKQELEDVKIERERLIGLIAALNARHEHGGATRVNLADELWRALPDDLRIAIEMQEAVIG